VTQIGSDVVMVLGDARFDGSSGHVYNRIRGRVTASGSELELNLASLGHCELPLTQVVEVVDNEIPGD